LRAKHLKELLTYRLNWLANLSSSLAAKENAREFKLEPRDWRVIALLGEFAPLSLQSLAREVDVDKSQASRLVGSLIERGLVQRLTREEDARGVALSLTPLGHETYELVFPQAVRRNELLMSTLSASERQVLLRCLDKLTLQAKSMLEQEKSL
jgi:DNA-binding MarR family transcriptional regulator